MQVTKDFTVKIGDFGLATNIEQHKMDDQYCVSQFYPSYAAPEVQNEGKYYRQSDVYSFGILVSGSKDRDMRMCKLFRFIEFSFK